MTNRKQLTPEHKTKLHAGLKKYHMKMKYNVKEPIRRKQLTPEHKVKKYHMKKKVITNEDLAEILMSL